MLNNEEWSFSEIRKHSSERAFRLERCRAPAELKKELVLSLEKSFEEKEVRICVDSKENEFHSKRLVVQFKVDVEIYDWFFNARSGYRAQFWLGSHIGERFNTELADELSALVKLYLNKPTLAKRLLVEVTGASREERCDGEIEVKPDFVSSSLTPAFSKLWMCEWLAQRPGDSSLNLGFIVLGDAERRLPKLEIRRWQHARNPSTSEIAEGLRAPSPAPEYAWLDLKGAFVDADGSRDQLKPQRDRAISLYERGWA